MEEEKEAEVNTDSKKEEPKEENKTEEEKEELINTDSKREEQKEEPKKEEGKKPSNEGTYYSKVYYSNYNNLNGEPHEEVTLHKLLNKLIIKIQTVSKKQHTKED